MMFGFLPLETERLLLRAIHASDLEFVYHHFTDPQVNRFLLDELPVSTRAQAQAIIEFYTAPGDKPYNRWVILQKSDGRSIGTCGYHKWQKVHHRAEIGFDLELAYWNQGLMSEALRTVLQFGFESMQLNRIEALVYPENYASLRVLEKLGFQKEGLLRQYYCQGGTYSDHWLLSLLRTGWANREITN